MDLAYIASEKKYSEEELSKILKTCLSSLSQEEQIDILIKILCILNSSLGIFDHIDEKELNKIMLNSR